MGIMDRDEVLKRIRQTASPLKKQLLAAALITRELRALGRSEPVVIGGCALSYYTREVYFTSGIDFAYADRESFGEVLSSLGFATSGRYWVSQDLGLAVEVPASSLPGEESPVEVVELEEDLRCSIVGLEDLLLDRLNACMHWKSEADCEMVELLTRRYEGGLDWPYLERKAAEPQNDCLDMLLAIRDGKRDENKKD
jgi:hypothetical protein